MRNLIQNPIIQDKLELAALAIGTGYLVIQTVVGGLISLVKGGDSDG